MSAVDGSETSITVRPGRAAADRARKRPLLVHEREGVGTRALQGADADEPKVSVADDAPTAGGGHLGDGERRHARVTSWERRALRTWERRALRAWRRQVRRASPRPVQPEPRSSS